MSKVDRRLRADFNGLFGSLLCLSHDDSAVDEAGNAVDLREGLLVTAFEPDRGDAGESEDLVATGVVERAPDWLQCRGSKWVLRIDGRGVRHEAVDTLGQVR